MQRLIISVICIFLFTIQTAYATQTVDYIALLKEMFAKVTIEKNDKAIEQYYAPDFQLYTNGKTMNFDEFLKVHQAIYKTPIQYKIRYDDQTLIQQKNKVAGRLHITTKNPNEEAHEIEVMLVAEYKDDKLYRLWELTYPDWSKMKAFKKVD